MLWMWDFFVKGVVDVVEIMCLVVIKGVFFFVFLNFKFILIFLLICF